MNKRAWGDGPWQIEPDELVYPGKETALPCRIRRNDTMGTLNGYVGVPKGHPLFEKSFCDIMGISVHWGLTFSSFMYEKGPNTRWAIGFDCGHAFDFAPGSMGLLKEMEGKLGMSLADVFNGRDTVYRDIGYVKAQVKHLAQ